MEQEAAASQTRDTPPNISRAAAVSPTLHPWGWREGARPRKGREKGKGKGKSVFLSQANMNRRRSALQETR